MKRRREKAIHEIESAAFTELTKEDASPRYEAFDVKRAQKQLLSDLMRKMVLEEKIRCDGRNLTTIRPIDVEQGLLPRSSWIFALYTGRDPNNCCLRSWSCQIWVTAI